MKTEMEQIKTVIKEIDINNIKASEDDLELAGKIIRDGGLVAFPTETVYGLGGNAFDSSASAKIYGAKGRPSDNPLIVHIGDFNGISEIAEDISPMAEKLMKKFWPGPITMIFKKKDTVPYETTGGLNTVAVRMPSHPIALELIRRAGVPIAAPSANTSGRPSPTTANHVAEDMSGRIDMIIDGGQVDIGIESTIVDMSGDIPVILRPGYITREMLEAEIGNVEVDRVVLAKSADELKKDNYVPKAPGMKYRHYAPKAELTMFEGDEEKVAREIRRRAAEDISRGKTPGIICTDETRHFYNEGAVVSVGSRKNEKTIAHNLYGVLRDFDTEDADCIYSETFYDTGLGQAIMNRLIKAAGYHVEKV